jgi:hypothetical protein
MTIPRQVCASSDNGCYYVQLLYHLLIIGFFTVFSLTDWETWTAAAFGDANPTLRTNIIKDLANYLANTPSRVPFSDWYNTTSAASEGFQARPVVGGHFAILALNTPAKY